MFPQLFGKYVLEREIAAGGMARVYLATLRGAVGFEKRLVVKQIRPELASDEAFVRRFVEEAKTAVELGHPNIVPVYELGVEQGIYYIAMEFCEGLTLSEVLAETGVLSAEEGAYLGIELCRALDYAHRKASIVHRDITPRNVMLDEEGAVRIIDFGIAAPVTLPEEGGVKKGELFGSPGHMPPEQIAGDALTPATDVFAVGVLLIEAWTGKPPFRRKTPAECLQALATAPPPVDAEHAELQPIADLIASAVAARPVDRPQSAELLARPLREFVKTADLGDLERRIGARVRKTRRKLLASSPWLLGQSEEGADESGLAEQKTGRVRAPSIGDTQTFAVRNDLVEWTRKLPSVAPPPVDAVVEPVVPSEVMSTRPLEEPAEDGADESSAESGREEPAPATAEDSGRRTQPNRAGRPLVSLLAVAVVAGAIWWGTKPPPAGGAPENPNRERVSTGESPRASTSNTVPSVPSSEPSAAVPAGSVEKTPVRPAPSAPASSPRPAPGSASAPTAEVPAVEPGARALLTLTASPPSSVSVSGRSYGVTPVSGVQLAPGSYFVSFENTTLGLRTGAQVTLGPGGKRTVHADFTDPSPRVIIR
ncbi:MAG: serine/threonine protein kinase [Myxococcales bacterium]|nr:serine/threonine protein kinase [Myxococcales bacterium]